jgi:adenylosuccinate synthase
MKATIVVGGQAGDEGKGKCLAYLTLKDNPDVVARSGGPNCGHTVFYHGKKYALSMIPSGLIHDKCRLLLGAGALVDPDKLLNEIEKYGVNPKRVGVDRKATVITQAHIDEDSVSENSKKIGTTKTGCGPAQLSRAGRTAILASQEPRLEPFLVDVSKELHRAKTVLVEGAQGFVLSNLHGDFPYVTSKDTTASGIASEVGIGPLDVSSVVMVIKSYTTRVGNGPLKGEMSREEAEKKGFQEFGTVTGRPRRSSEVLDFEGLSYAAMINSATTIALTKLDTRFPEAAGITDFVRLPSAARRFIDEIEDALDLPVDLIGVGQETMQIIDRRWDH